MAEHYNARLIHEAAPRETEGRSLSAETQLKATETRRERLNAGGEDQTPKKLRGRPKGSRTRPKGIITKEVATELLGIVKDILPEEYYTEMKSAVRNGKNISTLTEAKILMKLMGPPLWIKLIEEATPKSTQVQGVDDDLAAEIGDIGEESPGTKETNERIKIMMQLIQLVARLEESDETANNTEKPFLEIVARRGLDSERFNVLIGVQSGGVVGNADRDRGTEDSIRAIPDTLSERPFDLPYIVQGEADRVLNHPSDRDVPLRYDEGQL